MLLFSGWQIWYDVNVCKQETPLYYWNNEISDILFNALLGICSPNNEIIYRKSNFLQIYNRVHEREENFGLIHDKDTICSAFVLNLSLQMLSLTHLSLFRPGQITIFNSDLHHICPHLHSEANAQLSYLSSGQMSYLSLSQIPTNVTNIIFEPHLDCIRLTSNLFFRPVLFQTKRTNSYITCSYQQQVILNNCLFIKLGMGSEWKLFQPRHSMKSTIYGSLTRA